MRKQVQMSENELSFEEGGAESETYLAVRARSHRLVARFLPNFYQG